MRDFLDRIRGGVNVVGNASFLKNKRLGQQIDLRTTIRFNWIELTEDTGFRRDIVCTNFPHKLKDKYQWLVADRHHYGHTTIVYPRAMLEDLKKIVKKKPSNGCRLLYFLDQFQIQDVNVYGFDWKETPTMIFKEKLCTPENEHHDYAREKTFCLEMIAKNNWTHMK